MSFDLTNGAVMAALCFIACAILFTAMGIITKGFAVIGKRALFIPSLLSLGLGLGSLSVCFLSEFYKSINGMTWLGISSYLMSFAGWAFIAVLPALAVRKHSKSSDGTVSASLRTGCNAAFIISVIISVIGLICLSGVLFAALAKGTDGRTTDTLTVSETHLELIIHEGDIVDQEEFYDPGDEFYAIRAIDEQNRHDIARYMRRNDKILAEGTYYIPKPVIEDGIENHLTFDEYLAILAFEDIEINRGLYTGEGEKVTVSNDARYWSEKEKEKALLSLTYDDWKNRRQQNLILTNDNCIIYLQGSFPDRVEKEIFVRLDESEVSETELLCDRVKTLEPRIIKAEIPLIRIYMNETLYTYGLKAPGESIPSDVYYAMMDMCGIPELCAEPRVLEEAR